MFYPKIRLMQADGGQSACDIADLAMVEFDAATIKLGADRLFKAQSVLDAHSRRTGSRLAIDTGDDGLGTKDSGIGLAPALAIADYRSPINH